jgi:hypothetical protein
MWYEYRDHLPYMLHGLRADKPYVEVGVFLGHHMRQVQSVWNGRLIGIDPFKSYPKEEYPDGSNTDQASQDERFARVSQEFEIIRKESIDAARDFEDGSLSCVYLDSCHRATYVYKELDAWWPKICENGILAGHDFRTELSRDKSTWFGVKSAVKKWALKKQLALFWTSNEEDWYVLKKPYYAPNEILVVSNFFGSWPEECIVNHRRYCESIGYEYFQGSEEPPLGMYPTWSKIPALIKACEQNPEKRFIMWIDADIVFMHPHPLHPYCFKDVELVGGAYRVPKFRDGIINTCWFGFPNNPDSMAKLRLCTKMGFEQEYPHEEATLSMLFNARANHNVILTDSRHVAPAVYFHPFDESSPTQHVIGLHKHTRSAVLKDFCMLSRV